MALETNALNRRVVSALGPEPGERILELGCGHGRTVRRLAAAVAPGQVVGIDPSEVMRTVARRHLRRLIQAGRVHIEDGEAARIPEPDASFDRAVSVHTIYFWSDIDVGLRELHRVLRPAGLLLLAFHTSENPTKVAELPRSVYTLRSGDEVVEAMRRARFTGVSLDIDAASQVRLARGFKVRETR
jgi:ubiquinone/menaquinone biosynthesis C-methylase UbiE